MSIKVECVNFLVVLETEGFSVLFSQRTLKVSAGGVGLGGLNSLYEKLYTVKLGFKNRQNKNLLDFKNQITNYQLVIYVVNYSQDKNILDFKNQNGSDRKSS